MILLSISLPKNAMVKPYLSLGKEGGFMFVQAQHPTEKNGSASAAGKKVSPFHD
jgi:hypothetical protein